MLCSYFRARAHSQGRPSAHVTRTPSRSRNVMWEIEERHERRRDISRATEPQTPLSTGCKWVGGISDRKEIPEKGEEGAILGRSGERQVAQPAGTSGESDSPRPTNSPMND